MLRNHCCVQAEVEESCDPGVSLDRAVMSSPHHQEHVFCLLMDALQGSLQQRAQLDQALKAGHLNITKARYAMGSGSIGRANYGSNMQAITYLNHVQHDNIQEQPFSLARLSGKVVQQPSQLNEQTDSNQAVHSSKLASVNRGSNMAAAPMEQKAAQHERGSEHSQSSAPQEITQPQKNTESADACSSAIADLAARFDSQYMDDVHPAHHPTVITDPLKWFGYMVSPYLRQAQSSFAQAAETAVQLANTQQQIIAAMKELEHMTRVKNNGQVDLASKSQDESSLDQRQSASDA